MVPEDPEEVPYVEEGVEEVEETSGEGEATQDEIAETSSGEQDYSSLTELSRDVYLDLQNPKSKANLRRGDYLRKIKNDNTPVRGGATMSRRWIAIQAFNGMATQNYVDGGLAETGLIIRTSIAPENSSGWDQVVDVADVTAYSPANTWMPNHKPNNNPGNSTFTSSGAGGYIDLRYDMHAFSKVPPHANIADESGYIEITLEVTFASLHVQTLKVSAPVGRNYHTRLNYGGDSGINPVFEVRTNKCEGKSGEDWYSTGQNWLQSETGPGTPYSILTVWGPGVGTLAASFKAYQMYKYYPNNSISTSPFHFVNGHDSWNDPFAIEYQFNGLVTPDQVSTQKWIRRRIDIMSQQNNPNHTPNINGRSHSWYIANFVTGSNVTTPDTYFEPSPSGVFGPWNDWANNISTLQGNQKNQYFTGTTYYAENIVSCFSGPGGETTYYKVCATSGNPSYYLTTGKDCYGVTIPATDLPGGANYSNTVYTHDDACCSDCGTLLIQTIFNNNATYGVNNGYIQWDATDYSTGTASGDPWNSDSWYTLQVLDSSGTAAGATAPPTGGNNFDDATCDTVSGSPNISCDSSVRIAPGMQVTGTDIPANSFVGAITAGTVGVDVTGFILANDTGNPVNATGNNTNTTLTFAIGRQGQHGGLAPNIDSNGNVDPANPYYVICVTDEAGCKECTTFTIEENANEQGCTDSGSLNYDSGATIDDGSCIKCESADGKLHDPNSSSAINAFNLNQSIQPTSATWGGSSHNSDGTLAFSAHIIAALVPYIDLDANSKYELLLYKVLSYGDTSASSGASQIGPTINAGTLNNVGLHANHTWTGLAFGFYSVRVRYVDDNSVSNVEDCWTEFPAIVQAQVCDISTNSSYNTTPSDSLLRDEQNSLLCAASESCCTLTTLELDTTTNGSLCEPAIYTIIECDPGRTVQVVWEFQPIGGSYTQIGTYGGWWVTNSPTGLWAFQSNNVNLQNWFTQHGAGSYKITVQATSDSGDVCTVSNSRFFNYPIYGCTTPGAVNYNPSAVCDDGSCYWETWDCDGIGGCFDPGGGTGQYSTFAACQSACIPPPSDGCTDPCAGNYDSNANSDDGSCWYVGCLDSTASNYGWSCNCNKLINISQIQYNDQTCCIDSPCTSNQNTITVTTTDATGDCTTFNADGTALVSVNLTTGATTWTWEIYNSGGSTLIYSDTTIYNDGASSNPYTTLMQGTYDVTITDDLGCEQTEHFTIESSSPQVGCMDPNADNYDSSAECDCGCCEICGCMDPNAINFNPNANTNIGCECEYDINYDNPCIPKTLNKNLTKIDGCLSLKGTEWLDKYKVGRADDCTLMNKWKLILINYLLSKEGGLHCLFNCADTDSPDLNVVEDCDSLWKTGGRSTGLLHDPAHQGASIVNSGEGTTVTVYDGFPTGWFGHNGALTPKSNLTYVGDVIKFDLDPLHPLASWLNGTIWTLTTIPPNPNGMHQGCKNQKISHYTQCVEYTKVNITTSINYYDKFINFVNKFCRDCNISILKELRNL